MGGLFICMPGGLMFATEGVARGTGYTEEYSLWLLFPAKRSI
jgi:hypothetical protein